MFTYIVNEVVTAPSGTVGNARNVTASGNTEVIETIAQSATDQQIDISFPQATMKVLVITSTQDLTLKTNDSGTPTDTINIKAGIPLLWSSDGYNANPITADVTAMFATEGGVGDANLQISVLYDATP